MWESWYENVQMDANGGASSLLQGKPCLCMLTEELYLLRGLPGEPVAVRGDHNHGTIPYG
jgi:hypothetical protein